MNPSIVKEIVDILIVDKELILSWRKLFDGLLLKPEDCVLLEQKVNSCTIQGYELFSTILSKWSSAQGDRATVGVLQQILKDNGFRLVAERLYDINSQNRNEDANFCFEPGHAMSNFVETRQERTELKTVDKSQNSLLVATTGMNGIGKSELVNKFSNGMAESKAAVEEGVPVMDIVTKHKFQSLMDFCAEQLNGNISIQSVITLFQQAMEFGHQQLMEATLIYICKEAANLIETDCFLELPNECLLQILKRDDLVVKSELELFKAVLRWGKVECKRKKLDPDVPENLAKVLAKALILIRFPNMDAEQFTVNVATQSVLGDKELISLILFFNIPKDKRRNVPHERFNATPRKYNIKCYTVSRGLGYFAHYTFNNPYSESLQLEVSKQIILVGLKIFVHPNFEEDIRNDFKKFNCSVLIESVPSGAFLYKTEVKEFNIFERIRLESVKLEPNSLYQITLAYCGKYNIFWDTGKNYINTTLVRARSLQSSCNVNYESENGAEKVHFKFSREDSSDWHLQEGFITELIFNIQE